MIGTMMNSNDATSVGSSATCAGLATETMDEVAAVVTVVRRYSQLLEGSEVVGARLLHQRSQCLLLTLDDGRHLFIKRALRDTAGRWGADLSVEARALALLDRRRLHAPRPLLHVDSESERLLVTTAVVGAIELDEFRRMAGGTSEAVAADLGDQLGRLHDAGPPGTTLPRRHYAAMTASVLLAATPSLVADFPAGFTELARALRVRSLAPVMEELAGAEFSPTFVHGDLKRDNVLCAIAPTAGHPRLTMVDWEMAAWGDGRWDIGCLIGDFVLGWVASMTLGTDTGLEVWVATATPPLVAVRSEVRVALSHYLGGRPASELDQVCWIQMAGLYLLQRVYANAIHRPCLDRRTLMLLHLSSQFLKKPHASLEAVL